MRPWLKIASILIASSTLYACVSTGAREITRPATTDQLEATRSTKVEVTALLGFPAIVTYGQKGEETWDYYYVTEYPTPIDFVPVVNALAPGFNQTTRGLTVSFDRQGVVQNLQPSRLAGKAKVYPY